MCRKLGLLTSMLFIILAAYGCVKIHHMQNAFDAQEAAKIFEKGNNTIKGSAFLRQQGGGTVTCASSELFLFLATAFADERMSVLFDTT